MKVACRVCCARRQLLLWTEKVEAVDDGRRGEERRLAVVGEGSFPIVAVFILLFFSRVTGRSIGENWRATVSSSFLVSMSHVVILLVLVSQNFRPACRGGGTVDGAYR